MVTPARIFQQDLIYAVAHDQSNNVASWEIPTSQQVTLQFKHALSQAFFNAISKSDKIHVQIKKIGFGNIPVKGEYAFPTNNNSNGVWTTNKTEAPEYQVLASFKDPIDVDWWQNKEDAAPTILTNKNSDNSLAMMLIPENIQSTVTPETASTWTISNGGAYISVYCKIWNIANPKADKEFDDESGESDEVPWSNWGWNETTDNLIFGESPNGSDEGYREIRIPLEVNWVEGTRYTYTIIFGTGNAGYTAQGNPAIIPMTYSVNVGDWSDVNKDEVTEPKQ